MHIVQIVELIEKTLYKFFSKLLRHKNLCHGHQVVKNFDETIACAKSFNLGVWGWKSLSGVQERSSGGGPRK